MDLHLLINNARAFKKSADRSLEEKPLPNGQIEFLVVPAVVNLAFSIELYLKFLLVKNNISARSHDLSELFNNLDSITQQKIINSTSYDENEFKSLLSKHKKAFIEWRYLHEVNTEIEAILVFMKKLSNCLEDIAKNM